MSSMERVRGFVLILFLISFCDPAIEIVIIHHCFILFFLLVTNVVLAFESLTYAIFV